MLIDELVSFCDEEYQNSECFPCSAKVMCERECGYNCKDCLDDIHFHHHTYRDEYNCERLLMLTWGEGYAIDQDLVTGQDWFDAFKRRAESLDKQYSDEDMEKYYPGSWLLWQIINE